MSIFTKIFAVCNKKENKATTISVSKIDEIDEDIDTMARTIWGEARGEGVQGMQAIACVIMNRFHEKKWYSVITGTIA